MGFLPIVQRELQVATRRTLVRYSRCLFALVGLWISILVGMAQLGGAKNSGQATFWSVACVSLLLALLAGPVLLPDAISRERRDGTLGLLFLSGLHGWDIVLGKLAAHAIPTVYSSLALIPILTLPLIFGGITAYQVYVVTITLIVCALLSLSLALAWSAFCMEGMRSAFGSVVSILTLTALGVLGFSLSTKFPRLGIALMTLNPCHGILAAAAGVKFAPQLAPIVPHSWTASAAISFLSLAFASWRTRHFLKNDPMVDIQESSPSFFRFSEEGWAGYRHRRWRDRLERNPYFWLATVLRPRLYGMQWIVLLTGTLWCLGLVGAFNANTVGLRTGWSLLAAFATFSLHVWMKCAVAALSTRSLSEDRNSGGLELLLVSGLEPSQIMKGVRDSVYSRFFIPLIVCWVMGGGMMISITVLEVDTGHSREFWMLIFLAGLVWLYFDIHAAILEGIRQALRAKSEAAALRGTLFRVLLPGWFMGLMVGPFVATSSTPAVGLVIWMALTGWIYAKVMTRARVDAVRGFRPLAAGLPFDSGGWELRDVFREAAELQFARNH